MPEPRTHWPDQSGSRACSCAPARVAAESIAATVATTVRISLAMIILQRDASSCRSDLEFMSPNLDVHPANRGTFDRDDIARPHRADAGRRSGVVNVAGIERIERRGEFDESPDAIDEMFRVRALADLPVHRK